MLNPAEAHIIGKLQAVYGKKINIAKLKEKYGIFKKEIGELARQSATLRKFMNELIRLLIPEIRIMKLGKVSSQNKCIVYKI